MYHMVLAPQNYFISLFLFCLSVDDMYMLQLQVISTGRWYCYYKIMMAVKDYLTVEQVQRSLHTNIQRTNKQTKKV